MSTLPDGPLVAWYGDDFTGASAVMEVLTFAGFPSVLFFDVPTPEQRARFGDLRGVGIAGDARARPPEWMERELPRVFAALRAVGAPVVHYKVCSTFDSAPHVGSIGKAVDVALAEAWVPAWVPMVVAAPAIGRWQAFGTLFARAPGGIHRLDRHPTMSVHPVTPMHEADVTRHLAAQTRRLVTLIDFVTLKAGGGEAALAGAGDAVVAIDVVDEETLAAAGALVWRHAERMFAVGSQGLEYALVAHWRALGLGTAAAPPPLGPAPRVAVVSGSCSPVTAEQIAAAEAAGFAGLAIDATAAVDPARWEGERARAVAAALGALSEGRDPILYTARGPADGAVAALRTAIATAGADESEVNGRIGAGLGAILADVTRTAGVGRACIAGGDTSSAAAKALGLVAVTAKAALAPGAALLQGHGDDPATAGLEIALKGGQMGPPDFFTRLRAGGSAPAHGGQR
jgi:uncharacterized protein YgbK (DUF1537 family)